MGPPRHLALLGIERARAIPWPVPFTDGIPQLLALRGTPAAALASGDPFWFGAGTSLSRHLDASEWRAFPGRSTFSLAAARMGWALEETFCTGLHAAPFARLRPHLAPGARIIALLRDGEAFRALGAYLTDQGFGASALTALEALGGPREAATRSAANALPDRDFAHPICAAIEPAGGEAMPPTPGRAETWFENDGQITRAPIRAITLAALSPRPGETLWDIGGGSGAVGIEWLLAHPSLRAATVEPRADRAARIARNAAAFGLSHRLTLRQGAAPEALEGLPPPDAVFIGGGLSQALLDHLFAVLPAGVRLVANAVTLESEALLTLARARLGGDLLRVELAEAAPLGPRTGWKSAWPVVQWSVRT